MPVTTKNTSSAKSKNNGAKTKTSSNKQGAVNIKTTSARDKAKNFDEGRRNDANSNEL